MKSSSLRKAKTKSANSKTNRLRTTARKTRSPGSKSTPSAKRAKRTSNPPKPNPRRKAIQSVLITPGESNEEIEAALKRLYED